MKLYYSPGACSLASHIALCEAGIAHELERVDLRTHQLADGRDYRGVNAKGYVPTLELEDGTRLTENAVVLQYIADRNPGTLAPGLGSMERYRLMEWLNFIASEVHKGFAPLWNPAIPQEQRNAVIRTLGTRFDYLAPFLEQRKFLTGDAFTIADAYLFAVLSWKDHLKVDLGRWPSLQGFLDRAAARPKVKEAMREENLLQQAA
ncbi:MAG TPA: glutathione transferase GstA [Casimicrobiaceae bacterium]|jgi:glutathione S-transferase